MPPSLTTRTQCVNRAPLDTQLLCLGSRDRNHVEAGGQCLAIFLAPVPSRQLLYLVEETLESGGMMHDQNRCALSARIVKTMDGLARDKSEGARGSDMLIIADTQHQLAGEDVEELVAFAMIATTPGPTRPSQTVQRPSVSASETFTVTPAPDDPTAMNRPTPGATTTALISFIFQNWTIIATWWAPAAGLRQGQLPSIGRLTAGGRSALWVTVSPGPEAAPA